MAGPAQNLRPNFASTSMQTAQVRQYLRISFGRGQDVRQNMRERIVSTQVAPHSAVPATSQTRPGGIEPSALSMALRGFAWIWSTAPHPPPGRIYAAGPWTRDIPYYCVRYLLSYLLCRWAWYLAAIPEAGPRLPGQRGKSLLYPVASPRPPLHKIRPWPLGRTLEINT